MIILSTAFVSGWKKQTNDFTNDQKFSTTVQFYKFLGGKLDPKLIYFALKKELLNFTETTSNTIYAIHRQVPYFWP